MGPQTSGGPSLYEPVTTCYPTSNLASNDYSSGAEELGMKGRGPDWHILVDLARGGPLGGPPRDRSGLLLLGALQGPG